MENKLVGISVSPGNVDGKIRIINNNNDTMTPGDIIVLPNSDPLYAEKVMLASGVICEVGGRLSHICVVALEMGIPCITQVENARKILRNGQLVYLCGSEGCVYL